MKKFLTAMLGSIAGFWISLIILVITFFLFIIVAVGNNVEQSISLTPNSVLHIELKGIISEREKSIESIYDIQSFNENAISYRDIINAIYSAKDDANIEGIYLDCCGSELGIASRQEIVEAIADFKQSGKWVYAYADNYVQGDYYIASVADSIFLNPIGSIDIHGLSATTFFYKGLMDKIGIEAQILKVGTYKSAVEPFILTKMSDASREQEKHYLGNIWNNICSEIAQNRNTTTLKINQWADSLIFTQQPDFYINEKIADKLYYRSQVETVVKNKLNLTESEKLNLITVKKYHTLSNFLGNNNLGEHLAILFATGDIVDNGEGGIVGEKMVPQILELSKDDNVKGLILRINSGGGSAFASEQIWHALEQFKDTGKPFYVSMGDVAASGGYYISCGADKIYAEPTTLTGSIGIFGIIPNIQKLLDNNLGITSDNVSTNLNGDFPSFTSPMTEIQKEKMQALIENGYKTFVNRCANGRGIPVDSILKIAEGRVWDGLSAKEIGLVDQFGGLEKVIDDMKEATGISQTIDYPIYTPSILDQIVNSNSLVNNKIISSTNIQEIKEYYKFISRIKQMSPIQCKMEDITIK